MKAVFSWLKKDPWLAGLVVLAVGCALWRHNPLVTEIIKEHDLVEQKSKLVTISYYYPAFGYFADIVSGAQPPKKEWMQGYYFGKPYIFHQYYQKAAQLLPDSDAAHFLLGFCEYYLGSPDLARTQYEASVAVNPYFFWSYYNLGVIYFQQGDFLKSAMVLTQALALKKVALTILFQNPFYRQIWRNLANPPQVLEGNLNQGVQDAALMLAACYLKAGAYGQVLQIVQSVASGGHPWHQDLWEELRKQALQKQSQDDKLYLLLQERIPVRLF